MIKIESHEYVRGGDTIAAKRKNAKRAKIDEIIKYEEVVDMIKTLYDERVFMKGIEKGIEKAEKKAYADKIETAKTLIQENVPIKIIAKSTKLTIEEIEALGDEI